MPDTRVERPSGDVHLLIDGEWTAPSSGEYAQAVSPATADVIGHVGQGTREDIDRAVTAATRASREWATRTALERATALERVAELIQDRRDALAATVSWDQGKPLIAESYDEVDELIEYFLMAARDVRRLEGMMPPSTAQDKRVLVYRVPRGVIGLITPWNWPYTMSAEYIAPALASGNAVVWTPAPTTSVCSRALAECIVDADLPPGVFNMVTGAGPVVGDELAGHPGVAAVCFTGSVETGLSVSRRAAGKAQLIELGGNGPLVVLDDADLSLAVGATLSSCFLCAGQSCTAGERLLIHESVREEFVDRLDKAVQEHIRLGEPFDPRTTMGPLNNERTAAKMDRHVADALDRGATLVSGGQRAPQHGTDLYWEPTILDGVTDAMTVCGEETFGPIAPINAIESEVDAIKAIDASPYGLLTSVFTRDLGRGLRFAEQASTGWVNINESSNYWETHLPFGGRAGSASGVGRKGGRFAMEDTFTELKTVVIDVGTGR